MSLLAEKPLSFSPSLAATIGLEEAVLLQILADFLTHNQTVLSKNFHWLEITAAQLEPLLPFWRPSDIQRIGNNLRDQGILLIASAPYSNQRTLHYALNETQTTPPATVQATAPSTADVPQRSTRTPAFRTDNANVAANSWQPDQELLRQLAQYNINADFASDVVPEFVTYWSERNEPHHTWGSKFVKHCLRKWREQQSREQRLSSETAMTSHWRPSRDASDILVRQAGINANFIEDAIPEFLLYWQERGELSSTWNSRFIAHVKRQWTRFSSTIGLDSDPRPITTDWRPKPELFDVLALANIEQNFAEQALPEFILFWQDTGRAESSWNTKFLQHVKRQWAQKSNTAVVSQKHEKGHRPNQSGSSRNRSAVEQLTDRSWAD